MLADWEVSFLVYDYLTRTACSETVKAFYAECSFLKSVQEGLITGVSQLLDCIFLCTIQDVEQLHASVYNLVNHISSVVAKREFEYSKVNIDMTELPSTQLRDPPSSTYSLMLGAQEMTSD